MDTINPQPQTLSPCSSGRRTSISNDCNSSPEFEFWMLRNPSFPQPNLLSADELIVDGVLLPLHLLPATNKPDPPQPDPETTTPQTSAQDPDPELGPRPGSSPPITESSSSSSFSASKRWKDIFKKKNTENNNNNNEEKEKEKEKGKGKKKEKKTGSGAGSSELNINIWPFSRSRSAGNAGTRPKLFPGAPSTRKVNSAPCSRSNSAGESKSRKWPSSPGRAGVHVGRSSPVWQARRAKNSEPDKGPKKRETATCRPSKPGSGGGRAKVLNLNVPMCIGYRHHLSCRSDDNGGAVGGAANVRGDNNNNNGGGGGGGGDDNDGGSGVNLFNLRGLFTKKSIVTSH